MKWHADKDDALIMQQRCNAYWAKMEMDNDPVNISYLDDIFWSLYSLFYIYNVYLYIYTTLFIMFGCSFCIC